MKLYFILSLGIILIQCFNLVTGNVYSIQYLNSRDDTSDKSGTCRTRRVACSSAYGFSNIDGSCNNIDNPSWGATNKILRRFLPPAYSDNKGAPRTQGKYGKLLSTRRITTILKGSINQFSSGVSHMHVLWGQLLAHDIVHTTLPKIDCECGKSNPECINIEIPTNDEQREKSNRNCMELARSKEAIGIDNCTFDHREQISTLSSFMDATFLYGKSDEEARELRDLSSASGQLKTVHNPASIKHDNLPNQDQVKNTNIQKTMDCPVKVHKPVDVPCFVAGDVRANENPGLTSIHTIMARYHNYVAKELKLVNPSWDGDRVFNVARHIMSALTQLISYKEYLPPLLGPKWMKRFGLELNAEGYWNGYDSRYNPTIMNAFTTAAFRYGHSQVAETLTRSGSYFNSNAIPYVPSASTFFSSEPLLEKNYGGSGAILRGFMTDKAEKTDITSVDALRNHLNTKIGESFGNDLFAINAQRGRDHGLPGYNRYRELCGLRPVTSFSDLSDVIPIEKMKRLERAYESVEDIDLFFGGLAENTVEGGEVGPTFACMLAYGFRSLKRGDRYWHEYKFSPTPFTMEQLSSLRKTTFASILCTSGEDMQYVVKDTMRMKNGNRGSIIHCGNTDDLDLSAWKENKNTFYSSTGIGDRTQWTPWFVIPHRNTEEGSVDVQQMERILLQQRPEEMCDDILQSETRKSKFDFYLQIRFLCPAGSISATDFPLQLSQDNYWTRWIQPKSVRHYGGQIFKASDFECSDVVFLQVRSGAKFAMETGDVFDVRSFDSFTCLDKHQPSGRCDNYEARALCVRESKAFKEKHPKISQIYSLDSSSAAQTFMTQPEHHDSSETNSIDDDIKIIADDYCKRYSICCSTTIRYFLPSAPSDVLDYAKHLCNTYDVCCDAHF